MKKAAFLDRDGVINIDHAVAVQKSSFAKFLHDAFPS